MIIMASASRTLVPAIARLVAADEDTVRDVIHLFNVKGLAGEAGPAVHALEPAQAQRREHARVRSERQHRWGRPRPKAA
jgi:hypothetical protein